MVLGEGANLRSGRGVPRRQTGREVRVLQIEACGVCLNGLADSGASKHVKGLGGMCYET